MGKPLSALPKARPRRSGLARSLYLWSGMLLATVAHGMRAMPAIIRRRPDDVHRQAIRWGKFLGRFSETRIHLRNEEKLHREGPLIFLCNHQSLFDIAVLYTFIDIPFRWMAKSSLFKLPIIGPAMSAADYISVERGDSKKALHSMFSAAELIQNGKSVIIFPEGTRGESDGRMLPFKKGAFLLAKKAAVTIQPIVLWGNHQVMPRRNRQWIQRFYSEDVFVEVLDPIAPKQFSDLKAEQLSEMIRARMEEGLERLRNWESESHGDF